MVIPQDLISEPYRRKYAEKYGIDSLINAFHGIPWKGKEAEDVYKKALDEGKKWEDVIGITLRKDVVY